MRSGETWTQPAGGGAHFGEDRPEVETPEGVELCRYFADIKDPKVRKRVLDLGEIGRAHV